VRRIPVAIALTAATVAATLAAPASSPQPASTTGQAAAHAASLVDPALPVIRVDAIVTDTHGRPLLNLKPDEFQLLDNGVRQTLDVATPASKPWVATNGGTAVDASPAIDSPADIKRAASSPGVRIVGLYLDEFHVSAGASTERVRHAALRFVDEHVRPSDLFVVLKPLDSLNEIRFTRDRAAVRTAIETFDGRRGDYTPRTAFEQEYMGTSAAAVRSARAQIVLSGIRALVTRIGELEGALGSVAVVTEGFAADGVRSRERRLPDLQGLVRIASRSRAMVYAFDPGAAPAPGDVPGTSSGAGIVGPSLTGLPSVARLTGGDAVVAGGDLVAGFQALSRDLDSAYVLTYRSSSPNDGRFHSVQVTSTRRDIVVRTRSGYWAPLPAELRAATPALAPTIPTRVVRRSPLIDSWFGTTIAPDGRSRVIFTWTPASLSARIKPIGRPELVTVKVSTPSGRVLFEGDVASAHATPTGVERSDSAVFETTPGRLQFDLTIMRADGTTLDTSAQDFEVPEVRGIAPVILQPQLFSATSAREFREISTDSNAAPLPAREFRRTERLLMRVPAYDAAGGPVKVSAKLINRVGAVLLELMPAADALSTGLPQFDISLARFAPGEYSFEVSANSSRGTSRQLIRFRITG
jgi:VWFA-related protein